MLGIAAGAVTLAGVGVGPAAAVAAAAAGLLWLAWRHDTATGALLPLAVLVLIALGVLTGLLSLLALFARR